MGDGAAAGADLDQLQGRDAHRQAAALDEAPLARDLEAVGDRRLAVVDDAELGGGAAHVEGQHVRAAVAGAEVRGDQRAGRRARFQQLHRRALGLLDIGEAAVRQHQQQRRRDAAAGDLRGERGQVALGQRLDVGVDDGRGGALVLADLRRHVDRGRQREIGEALGDELDRLPLVARVGVGVQEDDGERGDALGRQLGRGLQHGALVEGRAHAAVDGHPLRHLQAPAARHQRRRLDDLDVVELVLALAPDLQRVAEALGGDEPGRRALALDQRIGEERRGMHHAADVGGGNRALAPAAGRCRPSRRARDRRAWSAPCGSPAGRSPCRRRRYR